MWFRQNIESLLLACLIALGLARCAREEPRSVTPAFYHWQTRLSLSPAGRSCLDSLGCKKLYVKVLDVGRDPATGDIEPYSRLEIADTSGLSAFEKVPVVFITNAVFQNISTEKIEWLAEKVADVLGPAIAPGTASSSNDPWLALRNPAGIPEIQFDCDWTASTREAFFLFLKKIKQRLPENVRLSATIRLHQYKFPDKTGVPPVDRGMLMFYNTGDIENPDADNSIFRPQDALKYLNGAPADYPLPLDLALPLFSWGLVFRDGELWKIVSEVSELDLSDTSKYQKNQNYKALSGTGQLTFVIQKGTFLSGHYLRPGDLLRLESVPPELLLEAARLAAQTDLASDAAVAFFHLDSASVRRYPVQLLDSVCRMINFPEKKN